MFKSYEYYIFVSGIELIQMFKQNKLSDKQKSGVIKYILNYKSYKIQMLDVLQIKVKRKRKFLSLKVIWTVDDVIINGSNYTNNSLICHLINPVVGA